MKNFIILEEKYYFFSTSYFNLVFTLLRLLIQLVDIRENGRRYLLNYSLQNICIRKILLNKKKICMLAATTAINPLEKLGKHLRN